MSVVALIITVTLIVSLTEHTRNIMKITKKLIKENTKVRFQIQN